MGSLFKIQHYPGGSLMLILGVFIFTMGLLIAMFSNAIKELMNKKNLIKYRIGVLSILLIGLGLLLTLGGLPLGSAILSAGTLLFYFRIFLALFSVEGRKKFSNNLGLYCLCIIALGLLFKVQHYPGASIMLMVGMTSFVIFMPFYFITKFQEMKATNSTYILDTVIICSVFLSLILPINVSKEVLDAFAIVNHGLVATTESFTETNEKLYANFESVAQENAEVGEVWKTKALAIKEQAHALHEYVEDLKTALVIRIDGLDENEREVAINKMKTKAGIENKSDTDKPATMMINEGKAAVLKTEIAKYRDFVCSMIKPVDEEFKRALAKNLSTDDPINYEFGFQRSWESENFEYLPAIAVLTNLSQIQSQIRFVEYEIVSYLDSNR